MGVVRHILLEGNGYLVFERCKENGYDLSIYAHTGTLFIRDDETLTVTDTFIKGDKTKCLTEDNRIVFKISCDYDRIQSVKINGSMTVHFNIPLDEKECSLVISGSGRFTLGDKGSFDKLSIMIKGNGSVTLDEHERRIRALDVIIEGDGKVDMGSSIAERAYLKVIHSGIVSELMIEKDASLYVGGAGVIQCSASKKARVTERSMGGLITVDMGIL